MAARLPGSNKGVVVFHGRKRTRPTNVSIGTQGMGLPRRQAQVRADFVGQHLGPTRSGQGREGVANGLMIGGRGLIV
eukprot:scaffold3842_cov158-Amphora_coffeaeformis.AAC.12